MERSAEAGPAAEAALARRHGASVRLELVETLTKGDRRNKVSRYRVLEGPSTLPGSVIVKQLHRSDVPPDGLRRDIAAHRLLTDYTDAGVTPALLGWDGEAPLIVLEDLANGESLVEALLGDDASQAERVLLDAAVVLGHLHGTTLGLSPGYRDIRRGLGSESEGSPSNDWLQRIKEAVSRLGLSISDEFKTTAERVLREHTADGPFYALVHGDPCPDNWRRTQHGLRLFDFEFSAFSHEGFCLAAADAVCPRMGFPTCWCGGFVPRRIVEAFEATYRATLAEHCEAARSDEAFSGAMLSACAGMLLGNLANNLPGAMEKDGEWGISTMRPRVLGRLDAFLSACDEFGRMPAFEALARELRAKLTALWPETNPLALYPAFAGGG